MNKTHIRISDTYSNNETKYTVIFEMSTINIPQGENSRF